MPIREFICKSCKRITEYLLLGEEDNVVSGLPCDKCKSKNTARLISRSSFKFSKGGFSASSLDITAGNNEKETIKTDSMVI